MSWKKYFTKFDAAVFFILLVLGVALGTIGTNKALSTVFHLNSFWPGVIVQSVGCILFGRVGILAGVIFPIFSNLISEQHPINALFFTAGNITQCYLFYFFSKKFKYRMVTLKRFFGFCLFEAILPLFFGSIAALLVQLALGAIKTSQEASTFVFGWNMDSTPLVIIFAPFLINTLSDTLRELESLDEN